MARVAKAWEASGNQQEQAFAKAFRAALSTYKDELAKTVAQNPYGVPYNLSGTAIIRPDFPELLEFPYLWQQTEYVLGGGSSHYMFLVLAAQAMLQ